MNGAVTPLPSAPLWLNRSNFDYTQFVVRARPIYSYISFSERLKSKRRSSYSNFLFLFIRLFLFLFFFFRNKQENVSKIYFLQVRPSHWAEHKEEMLCQLVKLPI